ncbi:hypothetical protein FK529_09210 [Tsukamurella asaccharolytica]|uniref:DUF7373 domain-containing protein n=1 Tax=Tsukamurella asaccharolytica TaxID=2592067 RepID=A0A5C5RAQ2_9ACTN|nr:hypothetical protein [Tsukamurella asaccharolytica]TWS19373.1 hypothetical protein FK529_09210 [Tsukamurella asaccharolytica]
MTAAALCAVLAGCSTVEGIPVADPSVEAAFKLDTGNYPTTPRVVKAVTPADAWQQEGFRIGDSVISPWDVDSSLTGTTVGEGGELVGPVWMPAQLGANGLALPMTTEMLDAFKSSPFQAGFVAAAQNADKTKVFRAALFRYPSADAVRTVVDAAVAKNPTPGTQNLVPGAVTLMVTGTSGGDTVTVGIAKGAMLALLSLTSATTNVDATKAILTKAVQLQTPKIDEYKPSPSSGAMPNVPMDRDGIMSRTLASRPGSDYNNALSPEFNWTDGYSTAGTFARLLVQNRGVDTRWGVDLVGRTSFVSVLRLPNEQKAGEYIQTDALNPSPGNPFATVPGINSSLARCYSGSTRDRVVHTCAVHGRYVAYTVGTTLQRVMQAASAEYLILKAAGPN